MKKVRPIKRLLIANRGEIVCRIVATCRRMGIETVSVFAGDDAGLPHARAGDFNVLLEGETLSQTYLNGAQLIAIAKKCKADAVHPGYGFLSENAEFAKAVEKAGLVFVGPPPEAIAAMGDKAASRQLVESIGVPVIPGYDGPKQDAATFKAVAKKIGYPVLVKASAGGGGKGMRVVEKESELAGAIESARGEAENAFGNGRLLLEKYLVKPRHIEVQVFSDMHGGHVHLYERECSIQRRHQKVVEESPAPGLSAASRKALCEAAVRIASHIGYVGAGTVEFIFDSRGQFYFLEMNTRLQVEHPVTEMVTGLDLVRLQLEVAAGSPLPFSQKDIGQCGHAVEVRLYAEDAERGFLPSAGVLSQFSVPVVPGVRIEAGYMAGNTVSSRYDPMIAKICASGATREEATRALSSVLAGSIVIGPANNRAFLIRVLESDAFKSGKVATDFIPVNEAALAPKAADDALVAEAIAAMLLFGQKQAAQESDSGPEQSAWVHAGLAGWRCV